MKCVVCKKGETKLDKTTVTLDRDGSTVVFRGVPANVCTNCGEAYVDGAITARLLNSAETAVRSGIQVSGFHILTILSGKCSGGGFSVD